jgi:hypothetical protein
LSLQDKLQQQGRNSIDQGNGENTFGGFVAVSIDIKSEERNVQDQAGYRNGSYLVLVLRYETEEIINSVEWVKLHKIVDHQAKQGSYKAKKHTEAEVVFLEH